ncbi:hypothetical protein PMZ80_001296 [Knufia obscura]|nr:hypothetical protein PMZ80_001296 [Knufia obscura]
MTVYLSADQSLYPNNQARKRKLRGGNLDSIIQPHVTTLIDSLQTVFIGMTFDDKENTRANVCEKIDPDLITRLAHDSPANPYRVRYALETNITDELLARGYLRIATPPRSPVPPLADNTDGISTKKSLTSKFRRARANTLSDNMGNFDEASDDGVIHSHGPDTSQSRLDMRRRRNTQPVAIIEKGITGHSSAGAAF